MVITKVRATLEGDIFDGTIFIENLDGTPADEDIADDIWRLFCNNPDRLTLLKENRKGLILSHSPGKNTTWEKVK